MINLLKSIVFITILCFNSIAFSTPPLKAAINETNHFQFVISKYETKRQGGQTVNIYIKFAYKKELPSSKYFDYRRMREDALKYMEPTEAFPVNTYWELLATAMGREMMATYPLAGISIFLEVLDNQHGSIFEPGDHGPIYTAGDITPLDIHH